MDFLELPTVLSVEKCLKHIEGFPNKLVSTIMLCVKSVSFSVLINGSPSTIFKPKRGIRQGDPLSSYLFIVSAEVLSGLIASYHD